MIADKFVDLYARNSGVRDKLVAERDVVLTYALHALDEAGVMSRLAFKGGTCLRKIVFGSTGRFSEDLDFTLDTEEAEDDVLIALTGAFNGEHYGITFSLLAVVESRLQHQAYFRYLEFEPFTVRSLDVIEMVAEKIRAAFQRAKVRDLYDLHRVATTPFDIELLRRLVVLKLWQVRDPFDPDALFDKLRGGNYEWEDLHRLIRAGQRLDRAEIVRSVETRFASLRDLSALEHALVADARSGRNEHLAEQLREEVRGWPR